MTTKCQACIMYVVEHVLRHCTNLEQDVLRNVSTA
jgi:hypothetical protein